MTPPQSQTPETDILDKHIEDKTRQLLAVNESVSQIVEYALTELFKHARSLETRLNEALKHNKAIVNMDLLKERTYLLAQIAVKDEALKLAKNLLFNHNVIAQPGKYWVKITDALTNSPAAAQEIVERMERMEKCICFFASVIRSGESFTEHCEKALNEALSTTKKPEGGI